MSKLVFNIALWGQHPDSADRSRSDWESYLFDYKQDHTPFQTRMAILRATAAHIWWRATARSEPSTLPTVFLLGFLSVPLAAFVAFDPISTSSISQIHGVVATVLFVAGIVRTPWQLSYSRTLTAGLLLNGTSAAHAAIVFTAPGPQYHLALVGFALYAVGCCCAGLSALKTKTPLGTESRFWAMFGAGLIALVISSLSRVLVADNPAIVSTLAVISLAQLSIVPQLFTLWHLGQQTTNSPL